MAPGPCDYPNLRQYELELDPDLARDLQRRLVAAEFDVGRSQELALDHTVTAPLSLTLGDIDRY